MIKILKWELLKEFNISKWFFLVIFSFLLILTIIPKYKFNEPYDIFIRFSGLAIIIIAFFFTCMYPTLSLIFELRQPYALLEKSRPVLFAKTLIARLISNILIFSIGYGIAFLGMNIEKFFGNSNIVLSGPFMIFMFSMAIIYPIIIHCVYLISLNIPLFRFYPVIGTIIFSALFAKLLLILSEYLSDITLIVVQIFVAIIAFYYSCILYEKYYTPK